MQKIAKIVNIYGLNGTLKVVLEKNEYVLFFDVGEELYIKVANKFLPFNIEKIKQKNIKTLLIRFKEIDKDYLAEFLIGNEIYTDKDLSSVEKIINYAIIDGNLLEITNFYNDGKNDLIEVIVNGEAFVIPLKEEFIEKIEENKIYLKNLNGLINF